MRSTSYATLLSAALPLVLWPFNCSHKTYEAAAPHVGVSQLPAPPMSSVDVTLTVPMTQISAAAESQVPHNLHVTPYNAQANGGADNGGVSYGYDVNRSDINIAASGNSITLNSDVRYEVWGQARGFLNVLIRGHCGPTDNPPPTAHLALTSTISTDAQWNLVTHTTGSATRTGPCNVTLASIDIAPKVMAAVNNALGNVLPQVDATIAQAADLPARVQSAWSSLLAPVRLDSTSYLMVHPTAAGLTPVSMDNSSLKVGLHIEARPEIIVGGAPPIADKTTLPAAASAVAGNAFSLAVPVSISTAFLDGQIRQALKIGSGGVRYPPTGRFFLTPSSADVSVYGSKVVLRLGLTGSANAIIYLIGTPRFDPVTNTLDIPDLDYTVETKNLLAKVADWAEGSRALADVRQRLRINLSAQAATARQTLTNAINRKIGDFQLAGTLGNLDLLGIYPDQTSGMVKAYFIANGTVALAMQ